MTNNPLIHVGGVCGLALTFFGCWWMNSARLLTDAQVGVTSKIEAAAITAIHEEAGETRKWLGQQIQDLRNDAFGELRSWRDATDKQLTGARKDLIAPALKLVDARTGQALALVDGRSKDVIDQAARVRESLAPGIASLNASAQHLEQAAALSPELARNALGAVAAFKVTAGQTAQTMRTVEQAMPKLLETAQALESNSNETTAYSAALLKNLAVSSKPLPIWARLALVAGPPITQTGFTIASWSAIKGR